MDKSTFYAIIFMVTIASVYIAIKFGSEPVSQYFIGMSYSSPMDNNLSYILNDTYT